MEAKAVRRLCIIFFKGCSILSLPRPNGTSSLCTCANDHPTTAELREEGDTGGDGGDGRATFPLEENSGRPPQTPALLHLTTSFLGTAAAAGLHVFLSALLHPHMALTGSPAATCSMSSTGEESFGKQKLQGDTEVTLFRQSHLQHPPSSPWRAHAGERDQPC